MGRTAFRLFGGAVGSDGAELLSLLGMDVNSQDEWGVVRLDNRERARLQFGLGVKRDPSRSR
jgi:hypothetical protein